MSHVTSRHLNFMDALNVLACFAVVCLHCGSAVWGNAGGSGWVACVVIQGTCIFAVPVFVMLSGANLLGYRSRYSTRQFFARRVRKVGGMFLGLSVLYYLVGVFCPGLVSLAVEHASVANFLRLFLQNRILDIFWFFYMIIGLYAFTPVLSLMAKRPQLMGYVLALCLLCGCLFPLVNRFLGDGLMNQFTYPYFTMWVAYFVTGYLLNEHDNHLKAIPTAALVVGALLCAGFMVAMSLVVNLPHVATSPNPSAYDPFYASVTSPACYGLACCLFLLFRRMEAWFSQPCVAQALRVLAPLSFGVYGIHMLVLSVLQNTLGFGALLAGPLGMVAFVAEPFIVLLASQAIVLLAKTISRRVQQRGKRKRIR